MHLLGGSAVLHDGEYVVHLPRATAVAFAGHKRAPMVPAATVVKWRGQVETRVWTLMVMTAGEGRQWGSAALCADMPVPADGDSSDEGVPASDRGESDNSADDASSEEGWSSDSDQRGDAGGENPTLFALRIAALNVRSYQRKKTRKRSR